MKPTRGFTLIELLVALVVFAALAAAAYGGLSSIARTRTALAAEQDRFAAITRAVALLERDLRQSVSRPVLGNTGNTPLPALMGLGDTIELTRLGYANPRAESRSNLERVVYALDGNALDRDRYAVLDRVSNSTPTASVLLDHVEQFHLRYFGCDLAWRDAWPPADPLVCANVTGVPRVGSPLGSLPRAIEFRVVLTDLGEIRRVVELSSSLPTCAVGVNSASDGTCTP